MEGGGEGLRGSYQKDLFWIFEILEVIFRKAGRLIILGRGNRVGTF